jgi:hypothetical protein
VYLAALPRLAADGIYHPLPNADLVLSVQHVKVNSSILDRSVERGRDAQLSDSQDTLPERAGRHQTLDGASIVRADPPDMLRPMGAQIEGKISIRFGTVVGRSATDRMRDSRVDA